MTNQAWTPGPWMFEPNGLFGSEPLDEYDEPWPFGYISHRPNMPSPIFELRTIFKFREDELNANAHLIAAAPEMFEALPDLSFVISWLENGCDPKKAAKELRIYSASIADAKAKAQGIPESPLWEGE